MFCLVFSIHSWTRSMRRAVRDQGIGRWAQSEIHVWKCHYQIHYFVALIYVNQNRNLNLNARDTSDHYSVSLWQVVSKPRRPPPAAKPPVVGWWNILKSSHCRLYSFGKMAQFSVPSRMCMYLPPPLLYPQAQQCPHNMLLPRKQGQKWLSPSRT